MEATMKADDGGVVGRAPARTLEQRVLDALLEADPEIENKLDRRAEERAKCP